MIKLEEYKFHAEGEGNLLINEAGIIIYRIAELMSKESLDTHQGVIEKILHINDIIKLTDSGMETEEAIGVLGLNDEVGIREQS